MSEGDVINQASNSIAFTSVRGARWDWLNKKMILPMRSLLAGDYWHKGSGAETRLFVNANNDRQAQLINSQESESQRHDAIIE